MTRSKKTNLPILLALLAILLIALAVPGIRLYHHIEVPTINKYRIIERHEFVPVFPFYTTIYDITLEQEIKSPLWYEDVSKVLREAKPLDHVIFHLAGYGGQVDTTLMLVNQIKESKAVVIMSVEAPVYSGHAFLALSGHKIIMAPNSFLMLHYSSILGLNCAGASGVDRGQPRKDKCYQYKGVQLKLFDRYLDSLDILYEKEKLDLKEGKDIYLFPEDIRNRGY